LQPTDVLKSRLASTILEALDSEGTYVGKGLLVFPCLHDYPRCNSELPSREHVAYTATKFVKDGGSMKRKLTEPVENHYREMREVLEDDLNPPDGDTRTSTTLRALFAQVLFFLVNAGLYNAQRCLLTYTVLVSWAGGRKTSVYFRTLTALIFRVFEAKVAHRLCCGIC
jgi:hypothetical protein